MPKHSLTLDVHKRTPRLPQKVTVRQGEAETEIIEAEILDDEEPYTSPLPNVRLDIMHADGRWARVSAKKSGSKVTCTLPNAALSHPGLCRFAHFVFFDGTEKTESTEGFELRILPCVDTSDCYFEAQSYDDLLTALWVKWSAYEEQAVSAESARVAAEKARASAETSRAAAEKARAAAEETRAGNEDTRKANETARKSAETKRANAETDRAAAEKARAEAEKSRVSAESGRVTAEKARATAEQDRASRFSTQMQSAQQATAEANGAAGDATAAAQNALNIANSIAGAKPPSSDEVEGLREQNEVLGNAVAELQDGYLVLGETLYAPSSRVAAQSGETVTLSQSSVSGETAKLD